MFHNSSNLYRNYNMPGSKGVGRDFADITQNIARTPVNVLVIAPARLVNQMFNLNHHIPYIRSRARQRYDDRNATGQPLNSAAKATQDTNAFEAALEAFGKYVRQELRPGVENTEVKAVALAAMKKLSSQNKDFITEEDLQKFDKFQLDNPEEFEVSGHTGLPTTLQRQRLCQAAIGQAWIDAGLFGDGQIEGAVPGFEITKEREMHYHQTALGT